MKRRKFIVRINGTKQFTHKGFSIMQFPSGEIFSTNPQFGKRLGKSEYKYVPGFKKQNLIALGVSDNMHASVAISVAELFKLARYAKKREAFFKKLDKKAKRRPGRFFIHAGNLTLCIERGAKR